MEKKIVILGVTGCIAAYKSWELIRLLQNNGYAVQVVATPNSQQFIGKATFEALTQLPVVDDLFDNAESPFAHITLAQKASAMVVAPCTANTLAKIANGFADNALTSTVLALTAPLVIAPAMNVHMYENPITQDNISKLHKRGISIVDADTGHLACGEEGKGKLAPIEEIFVEIERVIK